MNRRFDQYVLGAKGEDAAARWYEAHGYQVLARNWRCEHGELDLVLTRDQEIVICEVKTRSSTRFGTPFEAVGQVKQARLRRLAAAWLREVEALQVRSVRFDVAAVIGGRVEVREHAF